MEITDDALYKLLLDNQYLTPPQLEKAKNFAGSKKVSLYEAIISEDLISDDNLGRVISDYLKIPFVALSKKAISEDILKLIPEEVAKRQLTIAFGKGKKGDVLVATNNPGDKEFFSMLSKKLGGATLTLSYATKNDIEDNLRLYRAELQGSFDKLIEEQLAAAGGTTDKEAPISKVVSLLIDYAYENKASDIHIEPGRKQTNVRFRIDGVLTDVLTFPKELHAQVVSKIKVLSRLRTDEHLAAQDGKMQASMPEEDLDIRVSIVPLVLGEKIVMRLLSSHSRQFGLKDLGISEEILGNVSSGFRKPFGMVLSTGPTGSGKTTTIYAILKLLNVREKNISTIEDPVEYNFEGINQIQVNPKTNLTFADGLRSILRQDPDIVFVGEIRDKDTAEIAVNAATTGHLVLSTLHTNDAATALVRLVDMGIEPFLVASTVNVIIGQRLVRKICEKCRFSSSVATSELAKNVPPLLVAKYFGKGTTVRLFKGKGCQICHQTGYVGRIGIFEVMTLSQKIKDLIQGKSNSDQINAEAKNEGMITMFEDGLSKVQQGITTIDEVFAMTKT